MTARPDMAGLARARGGSSSLEFAIIIIPMMLMLMATFELGRWQWTRNALQEAATEAARCVGMKAAECGVSATAGGKTTSTYSATAALAHTTEVAGAWMVNLPSSEIAIVESTTCQTVPNMAQVTLTHVFKSGFLGAAGFNNYTMSAVACFPNQT